MTGAGANTKDAIIFVPGLGRETVDQRIDTIARRFAGALERNTNPAVYKFRVNKSLDEPYGDVYETPVRTIAVQRPSKEQAQPLVDLYMLDYRDIITRRFIARNPLSKVLVMLSVLLATLPKSLASLSKTSKSVKDQLQVLFIGTIIAAIIAYIAIIIFAGLYSVGEASDATIDSWKKIKDRVYLAIGNEGTRQDNPDINATGGNETDAQENQPANLTAEKSAGSQDRTSNPDGEDTVEKKDISSNSTAEAHINQEGRMDQGDGASQSKGMQLKSIPNLFQGLIVIITALGLFKKKSFKDSVSTFATEFVCAGNYLRLADQKQIILGQAEDLLEHIAEKDEPYKNVHIVAYSFGTLVSLDLVFPHVRPGARLDTVKSLITIGCPFDMVRTYWPSYFTNRKKQTAFPGNWINLYAPLDIFGSNFRDDAESKEAERGITLQADESQGIMPSRNICYRIGMQTDQLSLFDILTVKGAKIHSIYWTGSDASEKSCFDEVAHELYGTGPILFEPDERLESEMETDREAE